MQPEEREAGAARGCRLVQEAALGSARAERQFFGEPHVPRGAGYGEGGGAVEESEVPGG